MSLNPQSTELVIELQPGLDLSSVGAKSANLGKAIEHGFRVPPGFVITRQALNLFLEQSDLLGSLQKYLDHPADLPHTERTETYRTFCQKLLATPIPQTLINTITPLADALFTKTSCGLVARSSSIYEDTTTASFAGVYESFLGIHSTENLWASIQKCWCSAWAPLALDYTQKMGIAPKLDAMAVLVQLLLPADSAGVLFTADPLTGNPWRFVLESSFGLARDLVASTGATPVDRFLFEWDTGEILGRDIAPKKTALVPGASGIDNIDIPPERQTMPSLNVDLATQIAQVGLQIDRTFGARADIEWVVERNDIHIVQVRPITVLPEFFPHHLPAHLADQTWCPEKKSTVTLPFQRGRLITERYNRYLEVGPVETPAHRKCGAELYFHGHRYSVQKSGPRRPWPQIPASQLEEYLVEYEPQMRAGFLHNNNTRFSATEQRAVRLENEVKTLEQAIDAILWAREEEWDLGAFIRGPSQHLCFRCRRLLSAFVDEHIPNVDVSDLTLGHHVELDPYWPHVLMADAEEMAKLLEPEHERFEGLSLEEFTKTLEVGEVSTPFIAALEDYCDRLGLVPPWQFHDLGLEGKTIDILRLIRNALRGGPRIAQIVEGASRRRKAVVAEVRETLTAQPVELARFERLHDWALFWGPALNHRVLRSDVPRRKLRLFFRKMREVLLTTGLVDDVDDILYFTVEDLKVIAVTGDIVAGHRQLQKRRLEYEHNNRLVAPAFLGKPPEDGPTSETPAAPDANKTVAEVGALIEGKPGGPGRSRGIVRRIETLEEGDDVGGEEDVVVLVKPTMSTNSDVPLLFSMLLRVRGLILPDVSEMWTNHISQIARECRVPIVQVAPSDLERLVEGSQIDVDGTRGIVTILDVTAQDIR